MSFGGKLAQIRAIQAWNSDRRAWSSAEEFGRADAPMQAQRINAHPLPALSLRGERRGRGAFVVFGKVFRKGFLTSSEF